MPAIRPTVPARPSARAGLNSTVPNSSTAVATKNSIRQPTDFDLTVSVGRMSCPTPAISAVLQMTLPSALPTEISGDCALPTTAVVETRISGNVVPRETIVAPTTICGIFSRFAIATAASTNLSPATQISPSPTTNSAIVQNRESGTENDILLSFPHEKETSMQSRYA